MSLDTSGSQEVARGVRLTPKQANRLQETLKQYTGTSDIPNLSDVELDIDDDLETKGKVFSSLHAVLAAFLGKEQGFVEGDFSKIKDILNTMAAKIAKAESFDDCTICIGLGGSETSPSVRAPAYIIPAIRSLQSFKNIADSNPNVQGCPTVRVFKASYAACATNSFDPEVVNKQSEITLLFLKTFLEKFFPDLVQHFRFESDTKNVLDEAEEVASRVQFIIQKIKDVSDSSDIASLERMREKHSNTMGKLGDEASLFYAAINPLYAQSLKLQGLGIFSTETNPSFIVTHGGNPEKVFNKIARIICETEDDRIAEKHPTVRMITKVGKRPVYYTARDGDILLDEPGKYPQIRAFDALDRQTHGDYKEILKEVDMESFIQFVEDFYQNFLSEKTD